MNKKGKVDLSVIIPVHNRHDYFKKCLKSVISQNFKDLNMEIIIIDEASEPSIASLIDRYFSKNTNMIRIIRNRKAYGPSIARTEGLKLCRGDTVAFLDSDDYWEKDFLASMFKSVNTSRSEIVSCLLKPVFSNDLPLVNRFYYSVVNFLRNSTLFILSLFNGGIMSYSYFYLMRLSCTIFTNKSISRTRFTESYKQCEDWKFYMDCIKNNKPKIKIVRQRLVEVPYHKNSLTTRKLDYSIYYKKLLNELPKSLSNTFGIWFFKTYIKLAITNA